MRQRKKWVRIAVRIVIILVLLDILVYLAGDRVVSRMLKDKQRRASAERLEWRAQNMALARLTERDAALPATAREVQDFLVRHVPPRREGYSRAATLIQRLTQQDAVQLVGVSYKTDELAKGEPLDHLSVDVDVQGPFANLLSFSHGLETARDFIVVRSYKLQSQANGGALDLRLKASLYLLP